MEELCCVRIVRGRIVFGRIVCGRIVVDARESSVEPERTMADMVKNSLFTQALPSYTPLLNTRDEILFLDERERL